MQAKKHKKLKKKIVNMENSTAFYLDGEEEQIAYQAKRDLELCSFQDNFMDIQHDGEDRAIPQTKKLFQESVRTTASHKGELRFSKKNAKSRYLSFRESPEKNKPADRQCEHKRMLKISNIRVGNCATQYSFPNNCSGMNTPKASNSARKWQQSPNLNRNFMSLADRRIYHNNRSLIKGNTLSSKNRSLHTSSHEEPHKRHKNFYSFNDTIQNYDPFKLNSSRQSYTEKRADGHDIYLSKGSERKEVSLRPQFIRLIKRIKEREQANYRKSGVVFKQHI